MPEPVKATERQTNSQTGVLHLQPKPSSGSCSEVVVLPVSTTAGADDVMASVIAPKLVVVVMVAVADAVEEASLASSGQGA